MTKRVMTKRFMKETGADKKTAMDYLRKSHWNYGQAMLLWHVPETLSNFADAIREIDWTEIFASMAKTVEECAKIFVETMQNIDWKEAIKRIQEEKEVENNEDTN